METLETEAPLESLEYPETKASLETLETLETKAFLKSLETLESLETGETPVPPWSIYFQTGL